jgi:drug/metabolite transporter (DMT)-like permease
VLAIAAWITGTPPPLSITEWLWSGAVGMMSLAIPFSLIFWAQQQLDSSVVAVIISTVPLFVLVFARVVLRETVSVRQWLGFGVGVVGLLAVLGPDALLSVGDAPLIAQLAALGAAMCYAISGIIVKKAPPMAPVTATLGAFTVASLMLAPLGIPQLLESIPQAPIGAVLALCVLGVVQTGLAQLLRYWAVRRAGPVFFASVSYFIPIWAGLIGVIVLRETPGPLAIAGFGLILSGLFIARTRPQSETGLSASASSAG